MLQKEFVKFIQLENGIAIAIAVNYVFYRKWVSETGDEYNGDSCGGFLYSPVSEKEKKINVYYI